MASASIILHAHLPHVRHPEAGVDAREVWLFEAMLECYLPLIAMLDDLSVPGRLTLSLSPPLMSMLQDEFLVERFQRYLDGHLELARRSVQRHDGALKRAAEAVVEEATTASGTWERIGGDILAAFADLAERGRLELATCAGTHAILPLLLTDEARRLHIEGGAREFESVFGNRPRFMWLPECGYAPGVARLLSDSGIWSTVVEARALGEASPEPVHGKYAPIVADDVAVFARDPDSGRLVWSSKTGYPGDPIYREFHRDEAWDFPISEMPTFVADDGERLPSGVKLFRVTGEEEKVPWDRAAAHARAKEHARHFVHHLVDDLSEAADQIGKPAHLTCPYDAELFGHWWHEGPQFLSEVFVAAAEVRLQLVTLSDYLEAGPALQVASPATSTWGAEGDFSWWVDEATTWMIPLLHTAEQRWLDALERHGATRDMVEATREMMLAQASDWPFAIRGVAHAEYAKQRITRHLVRFDAFLAGRGIEGDFTPALRTLDKVLRDLRLKQ